MNKQGFTLIEILTAIIIIAILATVAMPLYEKTVERSHMAEARTILNRLQEAKRIAMDNMECTEYEPSAGNTASCPLVPKLKHLNLSFVPAEDGDGFSFETKEFKYSIYPQGGDTGVQVSNGVCAMRKGGPNAGTQFYYYGSDPEKAARTYCRGVHCDQYGLDSTDQFSCQFSGLLNTISASD